MKNRRYQNFIRVAASVCMLCFMAVPFSGCAVSFDLIDDWDGYFKNLKQYVQRVEAVEPESPLPLPESDVQEYDGLVVLCDTVFDCAVDFFGQYAYAELDGRGYAVSSVGKLLEIDKNSTITNIIHSTSPDITLVSTVDDLLIVEQNGLCGAVDLYGDIVVPIQYTRLDTAGRAVLAYGEGYTDVYFDGEKLYRIDSENAGLYGEAFINVDGVGVDLKSGLAMEVGEYAVFHPAANGRRLILDKAEQLFGYAAADLDEVVIEPQYLLAGDFSEGIACVYEQSDIVANDWIFGYPKLIDEAGAVVFDFSVLSDVYAPQELTVYLRQENTVLFKAERRGVRTYGRVTFDENGKDATLQTMLDVGVVPFNGRVYGGYIIDNEVGRFFSLDLGMYVGDPMLSVSPYEDMFICRKDSEYCLLDGNLSPVIENARSLSAAYGILLVQNDKGYAYYRRAA